MGFLIYACGGNPSPSTDSNTASDKTTTKADDGKGIGEIKSVTLNNNHYISKYFPCYLLG